MAKTDEISEGYDFIPRLDKKREKAAAKAKKRKEDGAEDFKGILGDDDSSDSEMVREYWWMWCPPIMRFTTMSSKS